jgi:hypothetical protein
VKQLKHPATIIAAVALFASLGGGAVAYATGAINGALIKNHSIATKKLTKKAIKQLHGAKGATGAPGAAGAPGVAGAPGPPGPIGPSSATSTYNTSFVNYGTTDTVVASLTLPAGSYLVQANTTISNGTAETSVCFLTDTGAGILAQNYTATDSTIVQNSLSITAPLTSTGSTVDIDCLSSDTGTVAAYTHLVAIKLGSVSGTLGHHLTKKPLATRVGQ